MLGSSHVEFDVPKRVQIQSNPITREEEKEEVENQIVSRATRLEQRMTRNKTTDVLNLLGDELGETILQGLSLGGGSVASGSDRSLSRSRASLRAWFVIQKMRACRVFQTREMLDEIERRRKKLFWYSSALDDLACSYIRCSWSND
jgi:hypothetical protein